MFSEAFLLNDSVIHFQPGYPSRYAGTVVAGSAASHSGGSWGHILLQDISSTHWRLRHQVMHLLARQKLKIISSGRNFSTSAILKNRIRQTITGTGRRYLKEQQFASAFSDAWSSVLDMRKAEVTESVETNWDEYYLKDKLQDDPVLLKSISDPQSRLPVLFGEPYRNFTPRIQEIIGGLLHPSAGGPQGLQVREELMDEYLLEILSQSRDKTSFLKSIHPVELKKVFAARKLIGANKEIHFTIPEIATAVDLNEFTLKLRFRQAEGMGLFEYLQLVRCRSVMKEILETDLPIKAFFEKSGYADVESFIRGFEKHIGCTPTALRQQRSGSKTD